MAKAARRPQTTRTLLEDVLHRLQRIEDRLVKQQAVETKQMRNIMAEMDDLAANVKANGDVEASAVALLEGLKAQLDAALAANNLGQIKAISDQLGQQTSALAAAVAANTPAAPTP